LDKVGQREIYDANVAVAAAPRRGEAAPSRPVPAGVAPLGVMPQEMPNSNLSIQPQAGPADDTEVICIVRSRSNPQASRQLLVLDRPSRELLDRLNAESQRPTSELAHVPEASVAPRDRATSYQSQDPRVPIVRAQSNDR
jgi:hypothetical protein